MLVVQLKYLQDCYDKNPVSRSVLNRFCKINLCRHLYAEQQGNDGRISTYVVRSDCYITFCDGRNRAFPEGWRYILYVGQIFPPSRTSFTCKLQPIAKWCILVQAFDRLSAATLNHLGKYHISTRCREFNDEWTLAFVITIVHHIDGGILWPI